MSNLYLFKDKQWLTDMLLKYGNVKDICVNEHVASTSIYRYIRRYDLSSLIQEPVYHGSIHTNLKYNFFDTIQTEEQAYWLGMFMSDGNIGDNGRKSYHIRLASKDYTHLYKFCDAVSVTRDIVSINKNGVGCACIYSKRMYHSLIQCGMHPGQKVKNTFPTFLPDELVRHFIRGYFDGDGSVFCRNQVDGKRKRSLCVVFFCLVNYNMSQTFVDIFESLGVSVSIHHKVLKSGMTVYDIKTESIEKAQKILTWMYNDSTIYMQRKYDKAMETLELIAHSGRKARVHIG